jgi:hypothetical protein
LEVGKIIADFLLLCLILADLVLSVVTEAVKVCLMNEINHSQPIRVDINKTCLIRVAIPYATLSDIST